MTFFLGACTVLTVSLTAWHAIRTHLGPYLERRADEQARGLPRGALRERWQHHGNGMTDDEWHGMLERMNRTQRTVYRLGR